MTTRRHFLQISAAAIASWLLPRRLFAWNTSRSCLVLHADSGSSWSVADPVEWALAHASDPVLERAREGLEKLNPADGDRVIRLIVRRCRLNLIELRRRKVVVHYWGQHGLADLRPFFKSHGLARRSVKVVLRDRKRELVSRKTGDDFLFGDGIVPAFAIFLYEKKWRRRFIHDANDWKAAPGTSSGFAWENLESNLIPWAALKSAWRNSPPTLCQNCDRPTFLINFGYRWSGMFNRAPIFVHGCPRCRRLFEDESITDVPGWIAANLDVEVWPRYQMMWDRRARWEGKS